MGKREVESRQWTSLDGMSSGHDGQVNERLTGRLIATMPTEDREAMSAAVRSLSQKCSLQKFCNSAEYPDAMNMEEAVQADVLLFEEFGVAVLNAAPDQRAAVHAASRAEGLILEEERWNYELGSYISDSPDDGLERDNEEEGQNSLHYLRGYRDGLSRAIDALNGSSPESVDDGMASAADFADSTGATWGLQATGVLSSAHTGKDVKVAVLDTGFDITHPDFIGRNITSESFIPATVIDRFGTVITLTDTSATVDVSGHGTHCIGTSCGARNPQLGPRYGIAHDAEIFNGKVLSVLPGRSRAAGADAWILSGIRWAIRKGCSIISLSLGSEVDRGESFLTAYESVAKSALENGVLIIAAAGNESNRQARVIRPVGSPANCPSIVAVGAVSRQTDDRGFLRLANFTNRHLNDQGGEVNFSGPGVSIRSSFPNPRHKSLDGTSQATPHVAGIAALVKEETGKTGMELYLELRSRVTPQGPRVDYGNGLVQA